MELLPSFKYKQKFTQHSILLLHSEVKKIGLFQGSAVESCISSSDFAL